MTKKVYEMIDEQPVWCHLKENETIETITVDGKTKVYIHGEIAEMLGHIYLKRNIMEIVRDVFRDMEFYKIKKLTQKESSNIGDRTYAVHCFLSCP